MKLMKLVLGFILIFSLNIASVIACDINIKIKQIHGLQIDQNQLEKFAKNKLLEKGYIQSESSAQYLAKIVISKGRDAQVFDKFFAKASVSLYKSGPMENYTHGQGKTYDSVKPAYTYKMYNLAVENAVSHLPECLVLN